MHRKSSDTFNPAMDLRSMFALSAKAFEPGDGDEETNDGGDGGDGSSGTGGTGGEDGNSASGTGTNGTVKDPERQRLSQEAAARRVEAKAEKTRADALELELRKLTDKDKSELELAQRTVQEQAATVASLQKLLADQSKRLAFYESGSSDMFVRPDQALALMDVAKLEPDDEGRFDAKAFKAIADTFAKENPHMVKGSDNGDDDDSEKPGPSGRPSNSRTGGSGKGLDRAKLEKKFPALRGR